MDALGLLRSQVRDTWQWFEMTVEDVTEEQANWAPPGTANSIGAAYAHAVMAADTGINSQLYGAMPVIAARYGGDVGLSDLLPFRRDWHEWASGLRVDWDALRRYARRSFPPSR